MAIKVENQLGKYYIADDVISVIAGNAAMDVFGLVGMASRKQIKDGIAELLRMENFNKGIEVTTEGDEVVIDIYIIVSYGTKISEVAHNVQQKVSYTLEKVAGISISRVNVIVQGVRVSKE